MVTCCVPHPLDCRVHAIDSDLVRRCPDGDNALVDPLGCSPGVGRKALHLAGHNRGSLACLGGTRRLDRRRGPNIPP
jgi:hypothetical protein